MNPLSAANAYASAVKALKPGGDSALPSAGLAEQGGFAGLLQSAFESATSTGQAVEAGASQLAAGKTDVVDLVTAVAETELAVETLVSVRDRVIAAYQDILNMPI